VTILKLWVKRFKTNYWRPNTDYIKEIISVTKNHIQNGDVVALSEKAISTASGLLIDEASVEPSSLSTFLATTWNKRIWSGPLGILSGLKQKTRENLKNYPNYEGAVHKQVALRKVGFLQSLRHYSEGGIDASNLPFAYVSMPLPEPKKVCEKVLTVYKDDLGKDVTVMIVDGDTTYSCRNFHLAPRKVEFPGLVHKGGFLTFLFGRSFRLKARKTPIGIAGKSLNPDRALWLANLFHSICGPGAGRTVWSMAEQMKTEITGVTWEMLETVDHYPIALFRFG
jgi:F420-0:gamma-glutamyl ligase-like protein